MNNIYLKKIFAVVLTLCMMICMLIDGTITASAESNELDIYLCGLKVSKNTINLNGSTGFSNLINGKSSGITETEVTDSIEITKAEKVYDSDYNLKVRNNSTIPSTDMNMYPGALLNITDQTLNGNISYISLERSGGNFAIKPGTNQSKVAIKTGKSAKFHLDEVNNSTVNGVLRDSIADMALVQNIKTTQVTSAEQTAAELGISVNDVKKFLPDNWTDIKRGKKQVAIALIRQNICKVESTDNLNYPSQLFPSSIDTNLVKNKISESNPAMFVKSVEYGFAYLFSAIVNTDTTYCDKAVNKFADRPDLEGAFKNYFGGKTLTQRQQNSINAARIDYSHIGGDRTDWSVPEYTTFSNIKNILPTKYISTKVATNKLVPLNFTAVTIGQRQDNVTWTANAAKYNFSCVSAKKLHSFWVRESAKNNPTKYETKQSFGINLETFNSKNKIEEQCYCNTDNSSRSRREEDYPAYQCVFGVWGKAGPKRNRTLVEVYDRIVHGAYYQAECKGDTRTYRNNTITGPVDLGRGVHFTTQDNSEDSYLYINGHEWGAIEHGGIYAKRLWDRNLEGKNLKNINGNYGSPGSGGLANRKISGTVFKSLRAIKKGFKATVNMQSESDGYEIRYSIKRSMKKAKKVKLINHIHLTKIVKKLKPKKKYYVQVRTYYKKNKTYGIPAKYSKWSAKRCIKTKK